MAWERRRPDLADRSAYPPIRDYALIGDCHSAALVSRSGSIDWCCLPRFDGGSCFGRILDWKRGGYCSITPVGEWTSSWSYLDDTMVLQTTFRCAGGVARLIDCFTMREGGKDEPYRQILRVLEGVRGKVDFHVEVRPRFDYGEVRPWIKQRGERLYSAIGGNDGLSIAADFDICPGKEHDLQGNAVVRAGQRIHLSLRSVPPERLDTGSFEASIPARELDRRLEETIAWWMQWRAEGRMDGPDAPAAMRSAMVLKALTNAPTGAMVAAPTTSLPEQPGGGRNWDYRFSWIRDSTFSARSLTELGFDEEADGFRRFVERSAAGSAEDLQIVYGVGGERRLTELELDLEGYKGARPVRAGNAASEQVQLDVYGELLDLSWRWHRRGASPDDDYWTFILELVEAAAAKWSEPDRGIWEIRGRPRHFVHSKVMCWVALDRGIRLAKECLRKAPIRRWTKVRNEIRAAVESKGYDAERGVFVQAFGSRGMDSALLLLPMVGFVDYQDERMVRTVDRIRKELDEEGLLRRYRGRDGLKAGEGVFLPCSFWLAECLAWQGRPEDAREVFDRAASTGNDLGLFSEEFDPRAKEMLGNFPQGLTHLSHIAAAVALADQQAKVAAPIPV